MPQITIIGTEHQPRGMCNNTELFRIMERLNPVVIFEEIPPSQFAEYWQNPNGHNLEAKTISLYLQNHQVELIPVDYDEIPESFANDFIRVSKAVYFEPMNEYRNLLDWHAYYVETKGFIYLNGPDGDSMSRKIYNAIQSGLARLNNLILYDAWKIWTDVNQQRDAAMIDNIHAYCANHSFERGLFLVGAAHRESIINKIQNYNVTNYAQLNWNYHDYENILY